MTRRPRERLGDILEAAAAARTLADQGKEAFDKDTVLQLAAEAAVARVGEAVRHLPDEVMALAPDVPWSDIRAMRNVMVHAYFDIETDVLWTTIAQDIPALATEVTALLDGLSD